MLKIGDIVRYDFGSTALMKITSRRTVSGYGYRYYGDHCMGGSQEVWHKSAMKATKWDLKTWRACKKWRKI